MSISTYTPDSTKIIHTTSVDFVTRYITSPVHVVQYDNTSPIIAVKLYSNGTPYAVPSSMDVNIRVRKPDNTLAYNKVLGCDSARTTVYVEVTQQMCAAYGDMYPVIEVTNGTAVAASGYIYFIIDENPVNDSLIQSTSEVKAMESYVTASKSWAVGGTGSRSGEDANNSKYYAGQAAKYEANAKVHSDDATSSASIAGSEATKAKTSETNAKTSETNAKTSETAAKTSETNAKTSETNAKTSETNAADSATRAEAAAQKVITVYKYKGSVATLADLPTSGQVIGDVWDVIATDMNYAWTGSKWDSLGTSVAVATNSTAGIVKPDGTTISVDADGTIHGTGSGDEVTIVKNSNNKLSVPIDNDSIYIDPADGKMKVHESVDIESMTLEEYEAKQAAGELIPGKYYAITDDTEPGGTGDGIIAITAADYATLTVDEKKGKTYQIIDDYEEPDIATTSNFGFVKLCSDAGVSGNGLALPTSEKNASVSGTLANQITGVNTKVGSATLTTTNKDLSGAVNELNSKIVQIKSKQYDTTTNASGNLSISGYTKVVAIELDSSMTNTTCILANSGTGNPIIRFKNSDSGASLVSTPVKFTMYYI